MEWVATAAANDWCIVSSLPDPARCDRFGWTVGSRLDMTVGSSWQTANGADPAADAVFARAWRTGFTRMPRHRTDARRLTRRDLDRRALDQRALDRRHADRP